MPAGRPSKYTVALTEKICAQIAQGKSLVKVLKSTGMPDYTTVMRWLRAHDKFRKMYTQAREDQADYLADEILDISDEKTTTSEEAQRNRLRVDTRKWAAGKQRPRKYGDKNQVELTGADGGPVENHFIVEFVKPKVEADAE